MANSRTVTKTLKALGLPVSLYKGKNYFYFEYFDDAHYDTQSEMIYRFADIPVERWVEIGVQFAADVKAKGY